MILMLRAGKGGTLPCSCGSHWPEPTFLTAGWSLKRRMTAGQKQDELRRLQSRVEHLEAQVRDYENELTTLREQAQ